MGDSVLGAHGKLLVFVLLSVALVSAAYNITHGTVMRPRAFSIVLAGLVCFLVAKLSVMAPGRRITFGTARMSENMANAYRLGYWLMGVGVLTTFV